MLPFGEGSQHWRRVPHWENTKVCWRDQSKEHRRKGLYTNHTCNVVEWLGNFAVLNLKFKFLACKIKKGSLCVNMGITIHICWGIEILEHRWGRARAMDKFVLFHHKETVDFNYEKFWNFNYLLIYEDFLDLLLSLCVHIFNPFEHNLSFGYSFLDWNLKM